MIYELPIEPPVGASIRTPYHRYTREDDGRWHNNRTTPSAHGYLGFDWQTLLKFPITMDGVPVGLPAQPPAGSTLREVNSGRTHTRVGDTEDAFTMWQRDSDLFGHDWLVLLCDCGPLTDDGV